MIHLVLDDFCDEAFESLFLHAEKLVAVLDLDLLIARGFPLAGKGEAALLGFVGAGSGKALGIVHDDDILPLTEGDDGFGKADHVRGEPCAGVSMGGEGVFQVFGDGLVFESGGRSLLLKKYDVFYNVSFHGMSFLREGERGKMGKRGRRFVLESPFEPAGPIESAFFYYTKEGIIMAKVIVISGHPHLERSIMNKTILEELKKAAEGGASIAIDDIAEKGCCHLDVAAEQALLKEADTIVFQFPVYWFNAPAMLKHWYEEVFTPGFAHGEGASGLKGKKLIISATAGAPDGAYSTAGMGHTLDEFFDNFYVMAAMTGMEMAKPILTYGAMFIPGVSTEADKEKLVSLAKEHAKKLLEEIGD